jgi:hypothetical protein
MSEHNKSNFLHLFLTRRGLLVSAIAVCIVLLVITAINRTVMAGSNMQQKDNVLAVITNSGSTNAPGSTLTVYQDGSAVLAYQKGKSAARFASFRDQTFPAGTFASHKLAALLTKIKDVSAIPDHGCLKSVSFGSTTTITFQGKTSGDLSCLSNEDTPLFLDLKHQVQAMHKHIATLRPAHDIL